MRYRLPAIAAAALLGIVVLFALSGSTTLVSLYRTNQMVMIMTGGQYDCAESTSGSGAPGVPAIQPHLPGVPAFSRDDVLQFFQTHGFSGLRFGSVGTPTITLILFTTSYEACELMQGESVGVPNDALVCYVELSGEFEFGSPFSNRATILHRGDAVFDARTGNLLVMGVGN